MKIDIINYPQKKTVAIYATTLINDKNYYLKFNKRGWLELEYVGNGSTNIPAFMEMPDNISHQFLSALTMALAKYGYRTEVKKPEPKWKQILSWKPRFK